MQTQKWVNLGFLLAGFIGFLFFSKLTAFLWDWGRFPIPEEWPIEPGYLVSFLFTVSVVIGLKKTEKTNAFLYEVVLELSRVSWPKSKETVASAGVVIVLVMIAALILFLIDTLWGLIIRGLLVI